MEAYKLPIIEMYNSLVLILSEKNNEILESVSQNKTNALSMVQNRSKEIEGFRKAIDHIQPFTNFEVGFKKDFEKIKDDISKITY